MYVAASSFQVFNSLTDGLYLNSGAKSLRRRRGRVSQVSHFAIPMFFFWSGSCIGLILWLVQDLCAGKFLETKKVCLMAFEIWPIQLISLDFRYLFFFLAKDTEFFERRFRLLQDFRFPKSWDLVFKKYLFLVAWSLKTLKIMAIGKRTINVESRSLRLQLRYSLRL